MIGLEDYFAVWDKDDHGEELESYDLLVGAKAQARGLELDPDLEGVAGLPGGKGAQKIKNAYEWANSTNKIPEVFSPIRDFINGKKVITDVLDAQDLNPNVEETPF